MPKLSLAFSRLGWSIWAASCLLAWNAQAAPALPPALEGVGIDQRLNASVPQDLAFVDETGKPVRLSNYLGENPAILVLAYYECPRLCTMVLNGLGEALAQSNLAMGHDYQVITVSINPAEGPRLAAAKKAAYASRFGLGGAKGWHFLTGSEESISKLASAIGFRYGYDAKGKQFLHASGIMVLTPQGRLSHYFYGITYPVRDLRLALVEASHGKIGTAVDQILLFCCDINLNSGKYTASIFRIVQVLGSACVLALAGLIFTLFRYQVA